MDSKKFQQSLNIVLSAATKLQCENMHHKKSHRHNLNESCPAELEIAKHSNLVIEHLKNLGILK